MDGSLAGVALRACVGLALGGAGLYLAARGVPFAALVAALERFDARWLVPMLGISLAIQIVRAWRWRLELRPVARLPLAPLWVMVSVAYMLINLLPLRVGEFVRPWLCSQYAGVPVGAVVGNLVLEKAIDATIIAAVFALALLTTAGLPDWVGVGIYLPTMVACGLTLLVGGLLLVRPERLPAMTKLVLPSGVAERVASFARSVGQGLQSVPNARAMAAIALLSMILWSLPVLSSYLLMHAFGLALPLQAALCVFVFIGLGSALPQAPGMVGTFQYACVLALGLFGVPQADAFAYGLVLNAVQLGALVLQGTLALCVAGASWERPVRLPLRAAMAGG